MWLGKCLNGGQIRLPGGDQLRQIGDDLGYDAGDPHGKTDGNGDKSRNIDGRTRNAAPDVTGRSDVLDAAAQHQGLRTDNAASHYPGTGLAAARGRAPGEGLREPDGGPWRAGLPGL